MALNRYKLGELIEQRKEKYDCIEQLPIRGVSREGFILPKQEEADLSLYNVFYKNDFVFNPARMELNSIALNTSFDKCICSSLYEIFYIKRTDILLPMYLNIFIKREEFARKCWFEAIGSARNYFRFNNLCEFYIDLPDIPTQEKYVNIYLSMLENQKAYEKGLEDLKLVCDGYIENLRKKSEQTFKIANYCYLSDERNIGCKNTNIKGLTVYKQFIETKADMDGVGLDKYKIVYPGDIAYVPTTNRNGDKIACGLCEEECIISSIYEVIKIKNKAVLLPEYLFMWFKRSEIDRYARYNSWGSARETITWDDLSNYEIPVPNIEIQQSIVDIYNSYIKRKEINEKLKEQIKNICPILVKGAIEEAKEA